MKSYQEQLEEVQNAISEILSGAQEASYNGQRVRKAELNQLITYERQLKTAIARENRGGIRIRGGTPV